MSTYRLKNLLSPRSVALVGASSRPVSVGRAVLENIRKAEFKGQFGLVNPRHAEIGGVASVSSLEHLLFVPELVVITARPSPEHLRRPAEALRRQRLVGVEQGSWGGSMPTDALLVVVAVLANFVAFAGALARAD